MIRYLTMIFIGANDADLGVSAPSDALELRHNKNGA